MNEMQFMAVLVAKRELALRLVENYLKALRNEENDVRGHAKAYYWFVYDAVYDLDAKHNFIEQMADNPAVAHVNENRLVRFWTKKDAIDELADNIWLAVDNGDIRL